MRETNPYDRSPIALAEFAVVFIGFLLFVGGALTLSARAAVIGTVLMLLGISYFLLKSE